MTTQCMKLNVAGASFVCTFDPSRNNPFRLYHTWYAEGKHRKLLAEYCNFESVLHHLQIMDVPQFKIDSWK